MENLKFGDSFTLKEFKELKGSEIEVISNPKTGKLFFSCGTTTGAVSTKIGKKTLEDKEPMLISQVTGEEGEFYMLHLKHNSANCIAVL